MKVKTKYKNINLLFEQLSKDSEEFKKQLEEMKKKYPLVALAYGLQKCIIKDLSKFRANELTVIENLYSALTKENPFMNDEVIQMQEKLARRFDHCIGVAGTSNYISIGDCIGKYGP